MLQGECRYDHHILGGVLRRRMIGGAGVSFARVSRCARNSAARSRTSNQQRPANIFSSARCPSSGDSGSGRAVIGAQLVFRAIGRVGCGAGGDIIHSILFWHIVKPLVASASEVTLTADAMPRPEPRHLLDSLRRLRTDAGLSQVELASRLGKPQSFVSKVETGERRLDILELRDVCLACGSTLARFVEMLEGEEGIGPAQEDRE